MVERRKKALFMKNAFAYLTRAFYNRDIVLKIHDLHHIAYLCLACVAFLHRAVTFDDTIFYDFCFCAYF